MICKKPDILTIHSRIIERTGGMDGLRDRAGLEAAIAAPLQTFGETDLFPRVPEKIAWLGYGLAANHAFLDGNKRIGAMMTQLLLQWDGFRLNLNAGELADMFIAIADGKAGEADLLKWIQQHIAEEESGLGR